jgi:hypothetical protein
MQKLFTTLFLACISTALFSQTYVEEEFTAAYLLGSVSGITLWGMGLWQIINKASPANCLVKNYLLNKFLFLN